MNPLDNWCEKHKNYSNFSRIITIFKPVTIIILPELFMNNNSGYQDNIFTKFAKNPAECKTLILENKHSLAFHDIKPDAKTHILIIPRGRYIDLYDFLKNASPEEKEDFEKAVTTIIENFQLEQKGFNCLINTKSSHGQVIFHFHLHLLSK